MKELTIAQMADELNVSWRTVFRMKKKGLSFDEMKAIKRLSGKDGKQYKAGGKVKGSVWKAITRAGISVRNIQRCVEREGITDQEFQKYMLFKVSLAGIEDAIMKKKENP